MKNEQLRTNVISKVVEMVKAMNETLPKNYLFTTTWSEFPNFIDVTFSVYRGEILIGNSVAYENRTFFEGTTDYDLDKDFDYIFKAIIKRVNDDIKKEGEQ